MGITNKDIIRLLRSVAAVYILKNENRFKIAAYEQAIDTIDHMTSELQTAWENNELYSTSGIGSSILSHIEEYFKKGNASYLSEIISQVPQSVFILMDISGIGPKKAYALTKSLQLDNPQSAVDDLARACETNKVSTIDLFGAKSQQDIYEATIRFRKNMNKKSRMLYPYAFQKAHDMLTYLSKHPLVKHAEPLGSLRRKASTIGDIDILVQIKNDYINIIDYFIHYPKTVSVINAGAKKASIIVSSGEQIDLRIAEENIYGTMLQYFTGSKEHNIKLREYALKKGYSLSEYGIRKVKSKKLKMFQFCNEEDLYAFLGLDYILPELREGTNEIELARKKLLPDLVTIDDIRGDFHIHSSYDLESSHDIGESSYVMLLDKTLEKNYEYIAFSDHNPSIGKHTAKQVEQIMKKRKMFIVQQISLKEYERVHSLISLEVDILPSGEIALPHTALLYVDMLIVAVHSRFDMSCEDMTTRILKALDYPKVKILAHPTTRLLNKREEIDADWDSIFKTCKKKNIAVEINASPRRLDLPDLLVRRAVDLGVALAIGTDSHAASQMDGMIHGVSVARRGWAKKSDIINTMRYNEVKEWAKII